MPYVLGVAAHSEEEGGIGRKTSGFTGCRWSGHHTVRSSYLDLDRGLILWQAAHSETPDEVRNSPILRVW